MSRRFTQAASPQDIAEAFHLSDLPLFKPHDNIAPWQSVASVRLVSDSLTREGVLLRRGLIPSWAKDPKIGKPVECPV
ncbi:MAG: SOS response-associated peptidase family protein [Nitrospira sp.]